MPPEAEEDLATKYTNDAQEDLTTIYTHIASLANVAAADKVIDAIVSTCDGFVEFPALGRRRPELDDLGLEMRSLVEGRYTIYYTVNSEQVYVVRVLHGARDLGRSLFDNLGDVLG